MEEEYLNYNNQKFAKSEFLKNSADNLQLFLDSKPWSTKRKDLFISAYTDIMNHGVIGASNESGVDEILYNGEIDFSNKSEKEKQMYELAAGYILDQINELDPIEEKVLPLYDNNTFLVGLANQISKEDFGNQKFSIQNHWNPLDERSTTTGLRDTVKRRAVLAKNLKLYSDSLSEDEFDFTNYGGLQNFKSKINDAIVALNTNNNVVESLNKIGLNYNDWFYDGGDDPYINGGNYRDYYNNQNKQQVVETPPVNVPKFYHVLTYKPSKIRSPRDLSVKFDGSDAALKTWLNGISQKSTLSTIDYGDIGGAFETYKNYLISPSEDDIQRFKNGRYNTDYRNLKKIPGVDNLFLDTSNGNIVRTLLNKPTPKEDINPLKTAHPDTVKAQQRQAFLNRTEWTDYDTKILFSIGADLTSLLLPDYAMAAAAGQAAAGIRTEAELHKPGGATTKDYYNMALDHLLEFGAAVPVLGDSYLVFKIINNVRKIAAPLLMIVGTAYAGTTVYNAISKLSKGEDLSQQEKTELIQQLPNILNIIRMGKRTGEAKLIKEVNGSQTGTLEFTTNGGKKIKINGLAEDKAKTLQKSLKGKTSEEKAKILREDDDIVEAVKKQHNGLDITKPDVEVKLKDQSGVISRHQKPKEIKTEPASVDPKTRERFQSYLDESKKSNWIKRHHAARLQSADKYYQRTGGHKESESLWDQFKEAFRFKNNEILKEIKNPKETPKATETPKTVETPKETPKTEPVSGSTEIPKITTELREEFQQILKGKSPTSAKALNKKEKSFSLDLGLEHPSTYDFSSGELVIDGIKTGIKTKGNGWVKKLQTRIREDISSKVNFDKYTNEQFERILENIRQQKKKGYFKYGGRL